MMGVKNIADKSLHIRFGERSPSKTNWAFLFFSKLISRKYLKFFPRFRTADDFPTCRAPLTSNGLCCKSAFHFNNLASTDLAIYFSVFSTAM